MLRRRLVALSVIISSTSIGSVALLPASPAAAKTVTVKAPVASPGNPIGTEVITLRGGIGKTIPRWARLERKTHGRWVFVRRAKLARNGSYAFPVAMPAPAQSFRVVSAAVRGPKGKKWKKRVSRVRTVHRAIQTANVALPASLRVGAPSSIGLAFAPARPGRPVVLQVNENGAGWRSLANLAEDAGGRAAFSYAPPANGTIEFRAVALVSQGAPQVVGPAMRTYSLPTKRMKVAAHRGFSSFYPENTIQAYSGALANDADWVETDFQQTAPDVDDPTCPGTADTVGQTHWVALHNAGFLGTTNVRTVFPHDAAHPENASKYVNGVPLVERFTLCEVKKLDAGSWKGAQFANYRVPTLEETLDLVTTSTNRAAKLMVEPKLGTPAEAVALYDAIKAYDDAHAADPGYQPFVTATPANQSRALFNTFNINVARQLADQRSDAQIATVADSVSPVDETDPALFPAGVGIFINNALVTRARVDALHAAGKLAIVWTVNSESRWLELASLGVDILVTDKSKQARAALTGTD